MSITLDSVIAALRTVIEPVLKKDVVSLGMIKDLKIEGEVVAFRITRATPARPIPQILESQLRQALIQKAGAKDVKMNIDAKDRQNATPSEASGRGIPGVSHIIAVSSGKGGVGKSTVSANLACALALQGARVGLLDTDIYGPNIPTMMGVQEPPQAREDETRGELIIPPESHGVKVMSMGLLSRGDQPAVWRGPMLHSVVHQFLMKVDWGHLDYLIVDMPPGTGDVQLSLTQLVPLTGAVVVTTPQEVAMQDVRKAILMFEKVGVPILGIVENMSYFECDSCTKKHTIFGKGGGLNLSEKFRVPLLAELPLQSSVREAGDAGTPIVVRDSKNALSKAFLDLASAIESHCVSAASGAGRGAAPEVEIGAF